LVLQTSYPQKAVKRKGDRKGTQTLLQDDKEKSDGGRITPLEGKFVFIRGSTNQRTRNQEDKIREGGKKTMRNGSNLGTKRRKRAQIRSPNGKDSTGQH